MAGQPIDIVAQIGAQEIEVNKAAKAAEAWLDQVLSASGGPTSQPVTVTVATPPDYASQIQ